MDVGSEYVKMCEKAEEIQKPYYECLPGDWYYIWGYSNGIKIANGAIQPLGVTDKEIPSDSVWLPRQDQLQELVPEFIEKAGFVAPIASHFADFAVACANNPLYWSLETFEQLWLAFVMEEKYQKVWQKKDWIKENI